RPLAWPGVAALSGMRQARPPEQLPWETKPTSRQRHLALGVSSWQFRSQGGRARVMSPNEPSSATRPTKAFDCNLNAMAGFAGALLLGVAVNGECCAWRHHCGPRLRKAIQQTPRMRVTMGAPIRTD